jgi:hypothetical protein
MRVNRLFLALPQEPSEQNPEKSNFYRNNAKKNSAQLALT